MINGQKLKFIVSQILTQTHMGHANIHGLRLYWDHYSNPIHSSDLSGACVAVDVGEGGCSLISVWKFLKDLSRGEAGHQHVAILGGSCSYLVVNYPRIVSRLVQFSVDQALSRLIPLVSRDITYLVSGMSHHVWKPWPL